MLLLFAGTWKQYSKKATPQLKIMIPNNVSLLNHAYSVSFRCPYHANVMKILEQISSPIVSNALIKKM